MFGEALHNGVFVLQYPLLQHGSRVLARDDKGFVFQIFFTECYAQIGCEIGLFNNCFGSKKSLVGHTDKECNKDPEPDNTK